MKGEVFSSKNYGDFIVVAYLDARNVQISFLDTGHTVWTRKAHVLGGGVRDPMKRVHEGVGYLGVGSYNTSTRIGRINPYQVWKHMLARCYNSEVKEYLWYGAKGVYVHEDWFNFQNFAYWVDTNIPCKDLRYDLDKDIFSLKDTVLYSPDTCRLVSHQKNTESTEARYYQLVSPDGIRTEVYNLSAFCRETKGGLKSSCMSLVVRGVQSVHKGWTLYKEEEDMFNAK